MGPSSAEALRRARTAAEAVTVIVFESFADA